MWYRDIWAWHPPVGVWIGILGLLGVIVPLIRDPQHIGRREKAVWTVVLFALLWLEVKSVYQDRDEHDIQQAATRSLEEENFKAIAMGVQESISQSDRNFSTTMQQQSQQFSQTMARANALGKSTSRIEHSQTEVSLEIERIDRQVAVITKGRPSDAVLSSYTTGLAANIRDLPRVWNFQINEVQYFKEDFEIHRAYRLSKKEQDDELASFDQRRAQVVADERRELVALLNAAYSISTKILEKIPRTAADDRQLKEIQALESAVWSWSQPSSDVPAVTAVADYLDVLAKRATSGN